ncbi:hypothetical protein UlMin_007442, partial [Ulmus minor]
MGDKPIESKPGSTLPSSVTMSEIQRDRLTKIAIENWSKSGDSTEPKKQFDPELVKEIYQTELLLKERQRRTVPLHRVMILEVSQYLESYLWPNFDPEFEHVMWMMLMINEKGRELSIAEKTHYLVFMINAFRSFLFHIIIFNIWGVGFTLSILVLLVYHLLLELTADGDGALIAANNLGQVDDACVLYCERFMEFLIDLLSQLPTRSYYIFSSSSFFSCLKLSAQLVNLRQFFIGFEINDHVGIQLTDDEVLQSHYDHLQSFQLLVFKNVHKLRGLALANSGAINKHNDLNKILSVLSPTELKDLVCQ